MPPGKALSPVHRLAAESCRLDGVDPAAMLEHRAKKWEPVFRKKRCGNKHLERAA
jgi:hypothetical protein